MTAVTISADGGREREERRALGIAVAFHIALLLLLVLRPPSPDLAPSPERMTVSLVDEVGLVAAAPDPVRESRAALAPTLSDTAVPQTEVAQPAPTRSADAAPRRDIAPPKPAPTEEPRKASASRIGSDFLAGSGDSSRTDDTRAAGTRADARATASIVQAITRQIKPHWSAPQGVDAEQLVTILAFDLNEDGTLKGRPRVVSQSGVTSANATQKALHAERAIRAVQLAAPFDLPKENYADWKRISGARFDRNLSR